jgi:hypothetical protein
MDKKERLIFNLIFGSKTEFLIDLGDYVADIYFYDHFVDEVRDILRRAKVMVVKSSIKVDSKTAVWELKLKK